MQDEQRLSDDPSADTENYAFTNAMDEQQQRLRALEAVLDDGSRRHLSATGLAPGWRCLEAGAGGGSIAAWLAEQVAPAGDVLAVDLDTSVAAHQHTHPVLTFQDVDLLTGELPPGRFDLAHARLLIAWLPERQRALAVRRLIDTLKPGGWLVIESFDWMSLTPATAPNDADRDLFKRVLDVHLDVLLRSNGYDHEYGRHLAAELDEAGLRDIDADAQATLWRGGQAGMHLWRLTFAQLREPIIAAGITPVELDRVIALCDDPGVSFLGPLMVTARGRRPLS